MKVSPPIPASSRARKIAGTSVSIVVFELGTICPIRFNVFVIRKTPIGTPPLDEALLFKPGPHVLARFGLSVRGTFVDRPAVMVAMNPMTGLIATANSGKDRVRVFREDAVVSRVFDHQRRLRNGGGAPLRAGVG